ncbi:unnamed protein product, partial [Acanthoscelides obtectus]
FISRDKKIIKKSYCVIPEELFDPITTGLYPLVHHRCNALLLVCASVCRSVSLCAASSVRSELQFAARFSLSASRYRATSFRLDLVAGGDRLTRPVVDIFVEIEMNLRKLLISAPDSENCEKRVIIFLRRNRNVTSDSAGVISAASKLQIPHYLYWYWSYK